MLHAVALREDVRVEITTDLPLQDLDRVAATLRRVAGNGSGDPMRFPPVKDPPEE
jgi:hypothetical protein